jgi:AraC-like DNA-binding protein
MEFAIRVDQPDLGRPAAARRLRFGPEDAPQLLILNGKGAGFEGGSDSPDISLKWLATGQAEYRSEGRSYRLSGAMQLMLNRGQPYRMRMMGEAESFVLFFPKPLADAAWQAAFGGGEGLPEIPTAAAAVPNALQSRIASLRTESQNELPNAEALRELSLGVLMELMSLAAARRGLHDRIPAMRGSTRDELLRRLLRARDYLTEANGSANLAGAASAAALSQFHLIKLFGAVFGETPLAYAAGKRLDRARERLARSPAPIAAIAEEAGYESRTAFDRAFARRFGMTPGAVRLP